MDETENSTALQISGDLKAHAMARAQAVAEASQLREQEERERAARRVEQLSQAAITAAIDNLRRAAFAGDDTADEITREIEALSAGPLTSETFGERVQEAEIARAVTLRTLGRRLRDAVQRDERTELLRQAEQERQDREDAEREEQAARDAEAAQAVAQSVSAPEAAPTLRSVVADAIAILNALDLMNPSDDIDAEYIDRVIRMLTAALAREPHA